MKNHCYESIEPWKEKKKKILFAWKEKNYLARDDFRKKKKKHSEGRDGWRLEAFEGLFFLAFRRSKKWAFGVQP